MEPKFDFGDYDVPHVGVLYRLNREKRRIKGTDVIFRHRPEGNWSVSGTLRIFIFLEQP
jgi:hypothetical protein